ncbi:hypothetical protein L1D22_21685 [Vibrio sp. Isolate34]|uniref:hypothetical protein n=1 Tax=Vibrio sp. Isolate34 TaxID=2908540 RepID=UPI001EFDD968|nr:hypothetical protein [Vibrio sp. Isolate34]MCG9642452.1 hypothetical protein [Vibrio sp. Isolate34]
MFNVRHHLNFTSFAIAALFSTCAFSANTQDSQITLTNTNNSDTVSISTNRIQ